MARSDDRRGLFGFAGKLDAICSLIDGLRPCLSRGTRLAAIFEFLKENFQGNEVLLCVFRVRFAVGEGWRGTKCPKADSRIAGEDRWNLFSHGPFEAQRNGRAIYGTIDLCETRCIASDLGPEECVGQGFLELFSDTRIAAIPR